MASLTDACEQLAEQAREIRERLVLPEDASGALVLQGGRVVGLDLFDHHATLGALWPRLRDAYALMSRGSRYPAGAVPGLAGEGAGEDSAAGSPSRDADPIAGGAADDFHGSHATAEKFLNMLTGHVEPAGETLGLGQAYDIGGAGLIGSALWHDGRVCHLAAFADASGRNEAPDSSGGSRTGSDHDLPGYVIQEEEATVEPWAEF